MKKQFLILGLSLVLSSLTPMAFSSAYAKAGPCVEDIKEYCQGEEGKEAVQQCLYENRKKISCECREQQKIVDTKIKDKDCKDDIQKRCPSLETRGEILQELSKNVNTLSCECRENMKVTTEILRRSSEICNEDRRKFCSDVQPGGGRIKKCLEDYRADLSKPCKKALKELKKYSE